MHVDVDCGFEEAGVAAVIIFDGRMTRIVVNHLGQLCIASMIDVQLDWIG